MTKLTKSKLLTFLFLFSVVYPASVSAKDKAKDSGNKNVANEADAKPGVEDKKQEPILIATDFTAEFSKLSPDEQLKILNTFFEEMDKDKDENVIKEELHDWMKYKIMKNVGKIDDFTWKLSNPDAKEKITWEEYSQKVFKDIEGMDENDIAKDSAKLVIFKRKLAMKRRWMGADMNKDGSLDREEFADMLHPEYTKDLVYLLGIEKMEAGDKNADGKLTFEEYFDSLGFTKITDKEALMSSMRSSFDKYDMDKDSFLNKDEVQKWTSEEKVYNVQVNGNKIFDQADSNKDEKLSKQEVFNVYHRLLAFQTIDI